MANGNNGNGGSNEPRILVFDIETAGVSALKPDLGFVIIIGWKWVGDKETHALLIEPEDLSDFDDSNLLKKFLILAEQADLLVGHWSSHFDRKFIQGRLLINHLPPIPPTRMRDTCLLARAAANFSSNRLKHLAHILKLKHQKASSGWPEAWFEVMRGNYRAVQKLAIYCKSDVECTEELYLMLRPFDAPHPILIEDRTRCSVCSGEVEYRGSAWFGGSKHRRYVCKKCGKWGRESKAMKVEKGANS